MTTRSLARGSYAFFIQLYSIVGDRSSDQIISWSKNSNSSFIIWDVDEFRRRILPEFGGNFSEFLSELRCHRFQRIGRFEFGHENFVRGRPELLKKIMARNEKFAEKLKAKRAKAKARKARSKVLRLLQGLQI